MSGLRGLRRDAADRDHARAEAALDLPRPRQRLDAGLAAVLALLAGVGATLGFAAAGWIASSGVFDPPVLAPVGDPRILTDYRDNPAPAVDAIAAGGDLLIARQDGSIDAFDMAGRTFAAEGLPRDGLLSGDLALLAADCAAQPCPPGAEVFAITAEGGLARRDGGGWDVILGDMAFVGAGGAPVEQAAVRGWAVTEDGALVLVDAGAEGLGLFDQAAGQWQTGPAIADATLGPVAYGGAFWLAGPRGIHRIAPHGAALRGADAPLPGTEGEILSLAPSPGDGLIAVRRGACADGGAGCLSLLRVAPGGDVAVILAEAEANPDLTSASLSHVARQGTGLVTVGTAGVHRYDAAERHWRAIAAVAPTAWFAAAQGARLHVALPDRVLTIAGGAVVSETAIDAPLRQILPGDGGDLFGLDRDGRIVALSGATAAVLAPNDVGAPADATFRSAVALGDRFVALGPAGVLVHDIRARRYAFVPAAAIVPPLPLDDALVLAAGSDRFWLVDRATGEVRSVQVGGAFPAITLTATAEGSPGAAIARARLNGGRLELIGRNGTVYLPGAGGFPTLAGAPLSGPLRPVAMAATDDWLLFTEGRGIWAYDVAARAWSGADMAPHAAAFTDIALSGDRLLALDAAGTAFQRTEAGWEPVSGGDARAAIGAAGVQDALAADGRLYLAADDLVQAYLPGRRAFGDLWRADGRNAEILAIGPGGAPIWTNDRGLYSGEQVIAGGPGFADGWMGAAGPVAMFGTDRPYLVQGGSCLFRGAEPPRGVPLDVVRLDPERILVRTGSGAGILETDLHRWLPVRLPPTGPESRLLVLGGHLVRLDPDGMASVPLDAIAAVGACETRTLSIEWQVEATGAEAALADGAPEVLVLGAGGELRRWRDGQVTTLAVAGGSGPETDLLLRAYGGAGMFAAIRADALWTYDLTRRAWARRPFADVPEGIRQIDAVWGSAGPMLSVWDDAGRLWAGRPAPGEDAIAFARAALPVLPAVPVPPDEIRDMATLGSAPVVLGERRLLVHEPGLAAARLDLALPGAVAGWHLSTDRGGGLVLTDGPADDPLAVYRIPAGREGSHDLAAVAARYLPGDDRDHAFVAADGTARLVRIDRDLRTWSCDLPTGALPACDLAAAAPMRLAPGALRAFDAGLRILLTADALWRLDAAARPVGQVAGPAVDADGVLLRNGGALLFWEGPGRALWRIGADGGALRLTARADALRQADRFLIVQSGTGVAGLADGVLLDPAVPPGLGAETVVRRHFAPGGHVYLTAAGRAFAQDGKMAADPLLAFDPDARAVLPLPAGLPRADGGQGWLHVRADGGAEILSLGTCEVPPPSPPSGFIGPPLPPPLPPPPPATAPCMAVDPLDVALAPGEQVLEVARDIGGGLAIRTGTREFRVDAAGRVGTVPAVAIGTDRFLAEAQPAGGFADIDGVSFLNPPIIAGDTLLGLDGPRMLDILRPEPLPPYDNGWLAWDRAAAGFRMEDADGTSLLPAGAAIRDGMFIAAHPGQGAVLADGGVAWLNPFGLWHQHGDAMRRVAIPPPGAALALHAGVFLSADGGIAAADGTARPGLGPVTFSAGPITATVDPLAQAVTATIPVAGRPVDAFDRHGFLHDRRQSVAQGGGGAVYLTPIGLVPVDTLTGIAERPPGADRIAAEGGSLYAAAGPDWMRADGGQWLPSAAPFRNAVLAQEGGRLWERVDGAVTVRPAVAAETWRTAGNGLDFDAENLVAFAATPGMAVAVTRAGTHPVGDAGDLRGDLPAPLPAPLLAPASLGLDSRAVAPGRFILFARGQGDGQGGGQGDGQVWDAAARIWRLPDPGERPWDSRHAAAVAGISVDFTPAPTFAITLGTPGGGALRQPFAWQPGEAMPFDHVTALHADPQDGSLLIGTRMGLRRLDPAGAGFDATPPLVPDGATTVAGMAVAALGRPAASPDRIAAAFADGACVETRAIALPAVACAAAQGLDRRLAVETAQWRWTEAAAGVAGAYLLDAGAEAEIALPLHGHLPHDILSDRVACAGATAELWQDPQVLRVGDRQVAAPGATQLHCQARAVTLDGGATLAAGLYAVGADGVARFDGTGLAAAPPDMAAAVADRAGGRIVLDAGQMRYGIAAGLPVAQLHSRAQRWQDIPWIDGRLALDRPQWLAWRDGLQAVTAGGVVAIPGGTLDPDHVVAMDGAVPGAVAACDAQRVEGLDGRQHGLAAAAGDPLRLYCRDGTWLAGIADGSRDIGAFAPAEPAADDRVLVDGPGPWTVRQEVDAAGNPVLVSILFRDEPTGIAAGRFDFDTWRSVAAPLAGMAEILTDSGWWRAPADRPDLERTVRPALPVDPRAVAALTRDAAAADGAAGLCIALPGGENRFWPGQGALTAVEGCREAHGADGLWHWWQTAEGPTATATALNGMELSRRLVAGRFSDLVARGQPLRDGAGSLLVPAGAGVLVLSEDGGRVRGIYGGAGGGVLTRDGQGAVALVDEAGATLLAGESRPLAAEALSCPGLVALAQAGPRILRVEPWIAGTARVRLSDGAGAVDALMSCETGRTGPWTAQQDVSDLPRNLSLGAGGFGLFEIAVAGQGLALRAGGQGLALRADVAPGVPSPLVALVPRPGGQEVFLVDRAGLWSVSLAAAVEALRAEGAPVAPAPDLPEPAAPEPAAPEPDPVPPAPQAPAPATPEPGTGLAQTPGPEAAASPPPAAAEPPPAPPSAPISAAEGEEPAYDAAAVQAALAAATGQRISADGVVGPRTRAAIAAWQDSIGSAPTGFLSAGQVALLLAGAGAAE